MVQKPKGRSIEEFISQFAPNAREEYVTDPGRVEEARKTWDKTLKEDEAANIARGSESKIKKVGNKTVMESAPLDAAGAVYDAPKKPVAEELPEIPEAPVAPARKSAKNLIPRDEPVSDIPEQKPVEERAPASDSSFPWDRALIGATPLLVGLLTGNSMEGAQVAGNHLVKDEGDLYKRERDLASKLAEMKAKREAEGVSGGKRRFQAQTIAVDDPNSPSGVTNVKATFDTFTGKFMDPQGKEIPSNFIRSGFAQNPEEFIVRTDYRTEKAKEKADYIGTGAYTSPTTGQRVILRNGVEVPVQGQHFGEFNKKQEKDVETMVGEFTKSPAYQNSVSSLELAPVVDSLLNTAQRSNNPNSIAGNTVVLTMIRQAQRVGVASDKDAASLGGTAQWQESISRLSNKLAGTGESLTIRDIQELREISEIYKKRSQDLLKDYYAQNRESFSRRYGLSGEQIDGQLGPKVNPYLKLSDKRIKSDSLPEGVTYKGRMFYPNKKQPKATVPFEMNGQLYWTEPGEWDQVKKENPNAKRLK